MEDTIRVFAGQCTVRHDGETATESEGSVLTLLKPDNTVLVHDASGYRPAGWLTRADSVRVSLSQGQLSLEARSDGTALSVRGEDVTVAEYPATAAGEPVGTCPDCGESLVRAAGAVHCLGCGDSYPLARDATVTDGTCETCGLPTISVTRGADFTVCLDRDCEPIDGAVRERFDGEWSCRECGHPLKIVRNRTLEARCPNCETGYPVPDGVVAGTCACGLPQFETDHGTRCLDIDCPVDGETH